MKYVLLVILLFSSVIQATELPWQNWSDLKNLARLNSDTQSLLRSSYCPYNCRYDRTSAGDNRFYRVENGESVIFEELNPGAITRIWMTTGVNGSSIDLDENIHVKFYFNGAEQAQIEIPLPDLFNGSTLPFTYPLVANRDVSSGGNFSYVPISFQESCKITLTNAENSKLWFQFNHQRMPVGTVVNTFSLVSSFNELSGLLNQTQSNVWTNYDSVGSDSVQLQAGIENVIFQNDSAGWIKKILLNVDSSYYSKIKLLLYFDDQLHSELKLSEFFALGKDLGVTTQSLFVGENNIGQLYSYFPMPFKKEARISLLLDETEVVPVTIEYETGIDLDMPIEDMGFFSTQQHNTCPSTPLIDTPLLDVSKRGKWVGLFMELSSIGTLSRDYLEGDDRVFIDGDTHPTLFGTGTEDIFNGGFYFDQGDFSLPLNGSPYFVTPSSQQSITSAYRFMLTDGIEFQSSIYAGMENGAYGDRDLCANVVSYYYEKPEASFEIVDSLDLSSTDSINNHDYTTEASNQCSELNALYLDQPSTQQISTVCKREAGSSSFTMVAPNSSSQFRLRRLIDNHYSNQAADVLVNGVYAGTFSNIPEKPTAYITSSPDRRWQQDTLQLGYGFTGQLDIVISPRYNYLNNLFFTESQYQLLAKPIDVIFTDSFDE